MLGIYAKKVGMTQLFSEEGVQIPVTVLKMEKTAVIGIKTKAKHGYDAVLLGAEDIKEKLLNKPNLGQFKASGVSPKRLVYEVENLDETTPELGTDVNLSVLEGLDKVTVRGTSIGKGFAGTIKRHGFAAGPKTHGSHNKRAPGSIGACSYPARVFPGQRMPGHYGNAGVSVKNVKLVKIDTENNLIFLRGAVPGPKNSNVFVGKR